MKARRTRKNRSGDQSSSEVLNHVADLTKHVKILLARETSQPNPPTNEACYFCGQLGHTSTNCTYDGNQNPEEANYVGNYGNRQPRNDPYSNTYNPGWRNHPNFAWKDSNQPSQPRQGAPRFLPRQPYQPPHQQMPPPQQVQQPPQQPAKPSFEDMVLKYMMNQDTIVKQQGVTI